jgi:uncharacterized protein YjiS (DUF1127 family)
MKASLSNSTTMLDTVATGHGPLAWFQSFVKSVKKSSADRSLRHQLAQMDDAMLRDIGIDMDEIWRVRAGHAFTPRDWQ